ncbi:MAG TPA: GNAT family N-acetyltransferase [Chloroflexia bacterium]|jgi:GNAT superfamily N-acetyltransferase
MSDTQGAGSSAVAGVTVRRARLEDGPTIVRLITALADFEKLPPPDEAAQARLLGDAFGPHPRFEIFLAEQEGVVAGYAFVFETYSTFLALPTLYLEDLFVLPEHRGRKVGYALFLHCAREATRRGCGRFEWAVLDWNQHAINFYERLGARHLDDWRIYRLDGEGLRALAGEEPSASEA